jgi:hypothetical protein
MSSGNGIDLTAVHRLLTEVAQIVRSHSEAFVRVDGRFDRMDARFDRMDARLDRSDGRLDAHEGKLNELVGAVNEQARRLDLLLDVVNSHTLKLDDLDAGLASLRSAVANYHHSMTGHGTLLGEFEQRLLRVERHLGLEPLTPEGAGGGGRGG